MKRFAFLQMCTNIFYLYVNVVAKPQYYTHLSKAIPFFSPTLWSFCSSPFHLLLLLYIYFKYELNHLIVSCPLFLLLQLIHKQCYDWILLIHISSPWWLITILQIEGTVSYTHNMRLKHKLKVHFISFYFLLWKSDTEFQTDTNTCGFTHYNCFFEPALVGSVAQ